MNRNQIIRKKAFERDNFTCQKCKIQDKTSKVLEAHHINPLVFNGSDELENLITLCTDCHHFAPNNQEEFKEYLQEECTGTITVLIKSFQNVRKEHPELFNKVHDKIIQNS